MNAVKEPKENPYYYYLHDEDGKAYFGKTLAEHEANIANYLR
jgi:cell division protein YceG involved in septum cleavage